MSRLSLWKMLLTRFSCSRTSTASSISYWATTSTRAPISGRFRRTDFPMNGGCPTRTTPASTTSPVPGPTTKAPSFPVRPVPTTPRCGISAPSPPPKPKPTSPTPATTTARRGRSPAVCAKPRTRNTAPCSSSGGRSSRRTTARIPSWPNMPRPKNPPRHWAPSSRPHGGLREFLRGRRTAAQTVSIYPPLGTLSDPRRVGAVVSWRM